MKLERFVIGLIGTNCYIVRNEETKECVIIDPAACPPELISHIKTQGLEPRAILLTHGHFDHIMGIDKFREEFTVPVYAHEAEAELLQNASWNASADYGMAYTVSCAEYVKDQQILELAGMTFQVLYTPGHTIGGCCYYMPEEQVIFSGDTLFQESIGRTDLPTGSSSQLIRSIQEKLMPLEDEVRVYPGHMDETTIGFERQRNPFLLGGF